MSQGVVLLAQNNGIIDYIKQAEFTAKRVKDYLDLPTTLITNKEYKGNFNFDNVITINDSADQNKKRYYDGTLSKRICNFKNSSREDVYKLTPYEETLVLDTDYVVCNKVFLECFKMDHNFQIYKNSCPLSNWLPQYEFKFISDTGINFYWATCVFFRKNDTNEKFFNLVKHIKEHWDHYRGVFQISNTTYRNDFSFSIAIHIMNGYQDGDFAKEMPGKMYYSIDRDILHSIKNDEVKILLEKQGYPGQYIFSKVKGSNIHVMNKFSLERVINE